MGLPDLLVMKGLFKGPNVQVTHTNATEARSECSIAVDPARPHRLLGASKRFTNLHTYHFSLGPVFSDDGGATWQDLPPLPIPQGQDIYTDPSCTFHTSGSAWVMGDPGFHVAENQPLYQTLHCTDTDDIMTTQMLAFKTDATHTPNGSNWSNPIPIVPVRCVGDDKGWLMCDNSTATNISFGPTPGGLPKPHPASPYHGRLYAIWAAAEPLRFARSNDDGKTWTGVGSNPAGSDVKSAPNVGESAYAPDISIGRNGTIHVFWHTPAEGFHQQGAIHYIRSKDGGESFEFDTQTGLSRKVVTDVYDITDAANFGQLPKAGDWPTFPGAKFRVITLVCACCFGSQGVMIAWADMRDGHSRIYYSVSHDDGDTWSPSAPLLSNLVGNSHQFHPQLACTGSGVLGCAMYSYAQDAIAGHTPGISVLLAGSFDNAATWNWQVITDEPWNPALNAPWSHGDERTTFIGEYFGLDASAKEFHVLWTDTRTGVQDLFYCGVGTEKKRDFYQAAIDPLAVLLGSTSKIYVDLTLPDPPPPDVWTTQIQEAVAGMTRAERSAALTRVKALRAGIEIMQKELEEKGVT
jgi:hypothetical protein